MDWLFTGLIDVLIIVLGILFILIGYKRGFMHSALSLFGFIMITLFSLFFAAQLAGLLKSWGLIYPSIYDELYNKFADATHTLSETKASYSYVDTIGISHGIPRFFGFIINFLVGSPKDSAVIGGGFKEVASAYADITSLKLLNICSFFILEILLSIFLFIAKAIVNSARSNKPVRVIDGILGILFHVTIYALVVLLAFFIIRLIYDNNAGSDFAKFIDTDLKLQTKDFRIGKYFFQNNFFSDIINAFKTLFNS